VTFFLSSPGNQMHGSLVAGMPVLESFATWSEWKADYVPSYRRLLVDSGAYSELTGNAKIDLGEYVEFAARFPYADAWAGLDDISGNWRRSLENYKAGGFPTIHEADPLELLDELVPLARERGGWIGLGLTPPRGGKEATVRRIRDALPDDLHVHGWACAAYAHLPRFDSFDSTNAWFDAMKLKKQLHWLTPAECVEIVVKRYQRVPRKVQRTDRDESLTFDLEAA
jgi:hypothetical protein